MNRKSSTIACTLRRHAESFPSPLIRRPHVAQLFDSDHWIGNNIVVAGPAGSGKSTIAIQLGLGVSDHVHYISARGVPSHVARVDDATCEGTLLANLINTLRWSTPSTPIEMIEQPLAALAEAPLTGDDVLIIDDIDLVSASQFHHLISASTELMASLKAPTIIFVTRHLSDELRTWIAERGRTKILLPDRLAITEVELESLIENRTFGEATPDQVRNAWQCTGGWLGGMQRLLTPGMHLDDFVLDEIVLGQPRSVQNLIFALGEFPQVSSDLVDYVLRNTDVTGEGALAVLWQIPLIHSPSGETLAIPEALRSSLARLRRHHGTRERFHAACASAISWYIQHREFGAAKQLAISTSLSEHYLNEIHAICAAYALRDRWVNILHLTSGIPQHDLVQNDDLAFWTLQGLAYDGAWTELDQLQAAVTRHWQSSDLPLVAGRSHLLSAWKAWRMMEEHSAIAMATDAYSILPTQATQERLFATVTAEVASRHLGEVDLTKQWAAISNACRKNLSQEPEWWHINCGFYRLSHTAISGNLTLAYDQASLGLENIDPEYPRITLMFSLLMAYIEMELGHFDAAHNTLVHAERYINGSVPQSMFDMAMARYHLNRGEFHLARPLLGVQGPTIHNRVDHNTHRLRLLAQLEMQVGSYDLADDILNHWAHSDKSWPRYFGEPHHFILKATLQVYREHLDEALITTDTLIAEAQERGHFAYVVQALAIQIEALHRLGRTHERDKALGALNGMDGEQLFAQSLSPFGRNVHELGTTPAVRPQTHRPQAVENLTQREIELLEASASGITTREIAERFALSQSTVKNHMASIYKKLGVTKRAEALALTESVRRPAGETKNGG